MKKSEFKMRIIETSINNTKAVVEDFKVRIKELMESEAVINEEEIDLSQSAYNEQAVQEVNLLAGQLELPNEKLRILYELKAYADHFHQQIELGSVVVTNNQIFFICCSLSPIMVNGKRVIGLSRECPLYLTMKGLKKGDEFEYNKISYQIVDLF